MVIACLSYGERGESQFAWKKAGVKLEDVKAQRRDEAERAAAILGAEIAFFDAGDYPLRGNEDILDRLVDINHALKPRASSSRIRCATPTISTTRKRRGLRRRRASSRRPRATSPTRIAPIPRRPSSCSSHTSPSNAISSPT